MKDKETAGIHISIEEYNRELQKAEAEYERGEYTTHDEFLKQIKKWSRRAMRPFGVSGRKNK